MDYVSTLVVGVCAVNVAVLSFIMLSFYQSFKDVRSSFTAGLFAFAGIFLLKNVFAGYSYMLAPAANNSILILDFIEMLGLVAFLWVVRH